ncbi:related to hydrolase, CocE/NonD family [Melanopsichium pennsylvanicum]|uniref:Related to hydrolase, CocE/NonD family n=2 Tax=Melanopsichium pennsylvanicum TaxID=63383 RepID=A0AAJ4XH16_9BASI|nr:x-pro dipeptidyl-peptidase protein [Melanopsichium pennsylvanicum 4]SNX82162.1 related to hydrolase, CocE/NonD family [Melanopsichium pennsylvanicum]
MSQAGARLLEHRSAHLPAPVVPGANAIKSTREVLGLIHDRNVDIVIPRLDGKNDVCRCDVFRPKDTEQGNKYPVLITAGPYGKDIAYSEFYPESFDDLPDEQKSELSAWEVPEPTYWTRHGYIVVRVDEQGTGQSPGFLDTMSDQTANNFFHSIEWAASQPWSSGKVGMLGISYYAGSQWRVAARKPKGLSAMIPWEGMSDYYRDRVRKGGIYGDGFVALWQNFQINSNQYGRAAAPRPNKTWGPGRNAKVPSIEGVLTAEQLKENRTDQTVDNVKNFFLDQEYYSSREFNLGDIETPLLSVGNWGGIALHLRGNVAGYLGAGSKYKWLWLITGRHDLPFYLPERVELQKSFLDAFLHGKDDRGWLKGPNADQGVPAVSYVVRKGSPKYNTIEGDRSFPEKVTTAWPLPNTRYTPYFLCADHQLKKIQQQAAAAATNDTAGVEAHQVSSANQVRYRGFDGESVKFELKVEDDEIEITGHPHLRLLMSVAADSQTGSVPSEIDLFVTLRHLDAEGKEIHYTGTTGDPCPVVKGWLRASVRKVDQTKSSELLPHRNYLSTEVAPIEHDKVYALDVEIWPTNTVITRNHTLQLEVGPQDQQGGGVFTHAHPEDRVKEKLTGVNVIHTGAVRVENVDTIGISSKTPVLGSDVLASCLVLPIIQT